MDPHQRLLVFMLATIGTSGDIGDIDSQGLQGQMDGRGRPRPATPAVACMAGLAIIGT